MVAVPCNFNWDQRQAARPGWMTRLGISTVISYSGAASLDSGALYVLPAAQVTIRE
jgi:hypothetical protein